MKSINIPEDVAARYTNPDQFERFDAMVRKVLSVPHSEIVRRENEYKRRSELNPRKRGPKPKGETACPGLRASPQA